MVTVTSTSACTLLVMTVTYLTVVVSGYRVDCPAGYSLTENLRECYRQTGLSYKPGHPFINVRALVEFCSLPQSADPMECVKQAWSPCNGQWTADDRVEFMTEMNIVKPGYTYLCSQAQDLEKNAGCIESAKSEIEECLLNAQYEADKIRDSFFTVSTISDKQELGIKKSFGETAASCSFRAASQFCNQKIASIIGNFIYAVYANPYVSHN
ncbi:uncharacterized protein LOC135475405 [Liolophura sinensis]|uniref:uncharacterized protein LOC135475405 n=1 Tax=Liolophura sinensis TaxID=3198878 RepID=UPI0031582996